MTCLLHDIVSKTINNLCLYSFSGDLVPRHEPFSYTFAMVYKPSNIEISMLSTKCKKVHLQMQYFIITIFVRSTICAWIKTLQIFLNLQ